MGEYKFGKMDIPLVVSWLLLIFIGWVNIFAKLVFTHIIVKY